MTPEPRQWQICFYCGAAITLDGDCENCAIIRDMQDEFNDWGQRLEREKQDDEEDDD